MTDRPGYSPANTSGGRVKDVSDAASSSWVKNIVEVVNGMIKGRQNVVLTITLRAGFATTPVIDARIGPFSALLLQPLTSNAAAALYSATSVLADPATQKQGSVVFDHANNAQVDRTFNLVILG